MEGIHLGIKFPCDLCEYKSTQRNNLITHKKNVHLLIKVILEEKQISGTLNESIQSMPISFISKIAPDEISKSNKQRQGSKENEKD